MTSPEYEPNSAISFLEAIGQLAEDDGLILSREHVRFVRNGKAVRKAQVHYEGLNHLSEVYHSVDLGELVTDEFQVAVGQILGEKAQTPSTSYPFMRIFNNETGENISELMNIALLINRGELPIYARVDDSAKAGEVLNLGIDTLIRAMAQKVGVNPARAVIVENKEVYPVEDTVPLHETHFLILEGQDPASDEPDFDRRGVAMLSMLQMDLAQALIGGPHQMQYTPDGSIEIVIHIATRLDLQTTLVLLIDLVESRYLHLHYARTKTLANEEGFSFRIVNDKFTTFSSLTTESTLDRAAYTSYLAALEILEKF